jgi:hypothetical protein
VGSNPVHGERQEEYGPPEESFLNIAKVWSASSEADVSKEQVALCMLGLKLVRESNLHKQDNLDDIDGYNEILKMFHAIKDESE